MDTISIIVGVVGLAIGFAIAFIIFKNKSAAMTAEANKQADLLKQQADLAAERKIASAETKAEKIVSQAEAKNESIKQKKIREAKEKFARFKSEFETFKADHKVEMKDRENQVVNRERDLKDRMKEFHVKEEAVEGQEAETKAIKENLEKQLNIVSKKKEELDSSLEIHIKKLESIAKLTQSEAKEEILQAVEAKAETDALAVEKRIIGEAKARANKDAKKIIIECIQRQCAEYTIENTVSVFNLDSDDIKGQIIGREGRNIRALEAATGAEIVVDDTPEAIIISSFDPIRREVCRLSLKRLVADGRIHPARIEEVTAKVKKQLNEQIVEIGERTVIDLDIHGLDSNLIRMVGRMRFRSSYGQNLLKHSIETANLCAAMGAEIGLTPKQIKLAKRAGLLHDIGKVTEEESELPHAVLGMEICKKYNENPIVLNAVGAHHDEIEMTNIISPIVQACDAISGARPGARREILESYLKRLKDLEDLALAYDGVEKVYAMQAGRELRVMVESTKVSDDYADDLSFMISKKIEEEMQYPGQIKVTVIREKRATSFAR